jgi:hypothetical protein
MVLIVASVFISSRISSPIILDNMAAIPSMTLFRSTTFISRTCLRLNARSWWARADAFSLASRMLTRWLLTGWSSASFISREFRVAQDRRQNVVEIMGHAACEPSDGLHLLRLEEMVLKQPLFLCFLSFIVFFFHGIRWPRPLSQRQYYCIIEGIMNH